MSMYQCQVCGIGVSSGEIHHCKKEDMEKWYAELLEHGHFMAEFHPLHEEK